MVTLRTARLYLPCLIAVVLLALWGLSASSPGVAQTTTSTASTSTTSLPSFNMSWPVQFTAQATANLANIFGSCMSNTLSSAASAIGGNALNNPLPTSVSDVANRFSGPGGSCGGSDQPPQTAGGDLCTMATNADGSFDPTVFNTELSQLNTTKNVISCKENAFSKVMADVTCMQNQANNLQQQIQSLSTTLQQNLQKQQTDVGTIQAVVADRTNQENQVYTRLCGGTPPTPSSNSNNTGGATTPDTSSCTAGLVGEQQSLTNYLSTLSGTIALQQNGNGQGPPNGPPSILWIQQARQKLVVYAQERTMQLTSQCFQNTPQNGFQCQVNGGPCSPQQYVIDRVYQQSFLNSNGDIQNDAVTSAQATAAQQGITNLLGQLFSNAMTNQAQLTNLSANSPNADANSQVAEADQSITVMTPNDIQNQYGSQLASFSKPGFDVEGTVMAAIRNCYAQEQAAVNYEENNPSPDPNSLYNQAQAIDQQEATLKASVDQELNEMSTAYTQAMAALTLQHVPLTLTQCTSSTVENEMQCVTDLQANLRGILEGNTANATVSVNIPSTDAQNGSSAISFQCQGVDGCVTLYRQVEENLSNELNRLGSFQQQYVTLANQQTQAFMTQVSNALSGQSQMLQQKMQQLNVELAGLGVSGVKADPYPATPMTKDGTGLGNPPNGTGLYQMPPDLLATIGGSLVPPLPNLNGSTFTDSLTAISTAKATEDQNMANVNAMIAQISAQESSCKNKSQQTLQSQVAAAAQNIISTCSKLPSYCPPQTTPGPNPAGGPPSGANYSQVQAILTSLQPIVNSQGSSGPSSLNVTTSLDDGYDQACASTNAPVQNAQVKLQTDVNNLSGNGVLASGTPTANPTGLGDCSASSLTCAVTDTTKSQCPNYVTTWSNDCTALWQAETNPTASASSVSICSQVINNAKNVQNAYQNGGSNGNGSAN